MTPAWLDTTEYPFSPHYFNIGGHQLHYIDEGQGETILFVHGTPSWSFDYRKIILALRSTYRCIAVDHIGFGLSDKPETYDYSTQNHSKTLDAFLLEKQLSNVALVVVFLPVVSGIAEGMGIEPILLTAPVTLAASCGFMLPMATPPNAIVFGSGHLRVLDMVKSGFWLDIISILLIALFAETVVMWVF